MLRVRRVLIYLPFLLSMIILAACGGQAQQSAQPTPTTDAASKADLNGIKDYLVGKATALNQSSTTLKQAGDNYYNLAKGTNFDYNKLTSQQKTETISAIQAARDAWKIASPQYEQMEGIVAGVEPLSKYDVILDAGVSGTEGGDDVVPFDLDLPNGKKLEKPGNLFGVLEGTLWGTEPKFIVSNVTLDFDGNGKKDFGDIVPDANILKSASDALDSNVAELVTSAKAWQPTVSDTFTALTANVPTVSDFFESWKTSRFVTGDSSNQRDFAVISRLSDINDNITSWQTMYSGLSPMVQTVDKPQDANITKELQDLKAYVDDLAQQEKNGKHFTPDEADLLGAEAQRRADAINGQITQMAAKLNVKIDK